ncbi:MAG: HAD-IIIC family phosphatase [Candidatus Paceibacterota bacterium]
MNSVKKCLVLDLDNTLWGGIVGEDGFENIVLSVVWPGNAYLAFQQAILDLYGRGVILAINSRNNPEEAWNVIRNHPNMILKEKHFAASRINWNDKAQNIRELAAELNIGLDSMVFLDDDHINRGLVRELVPEVLTPDLPADPGDYARFLNTLDCFGKEAITNEDKMRGNLYVTERLRKEEEKRHGSREEFLRSLSLALEVYEDNTDSLERLSQLTGKTNQFNTLKRPLSVEEIRICAEDPSCAVFHASLLDKFGNYGIIAFALISKKEKEWYIQSLLMSCRVFGRGVEDAFLTTIMKRAREEGADRLTIALEETPKNAPAQEFAGKLLNGNNYFNIPSVPVGPDWITTTYGKF